MYLLKLCSVTFLSVLLATGANASSFGSRWNSAKHSGRQEQKSNEAKLPHCVRPVGTVAIVRPEKNWWQQYRLESPEALIKMYVAKSGCFTIVDRGRGFSVAEHERILAANGDLQRGSNIGRGQIKTADYVITPDIVINNNNSGGSAVGAVLGSLLGSFIPIPGIGLLAGNIRLNDKSADVTLAVTDVRTSEQIVLAEGQAKKTDLSFGAGGGMFAGGGFSAAGVSSYSNTSLGRVVALAYLNAYGKMIKNIQNLNPNTAPQANQEAVAMERSGHLFRKPSAKSAIVRALSPGTMLYSTGRKSGGWIEAADKKGNTGWVWIKLLNLN